MASVVTDAELKRKGLESRMGALYKDDLDRSGKPFDWREIAKMKLPELQALFDAEGDRLWDRLEDVYGILYIAPHYYGRGGKIV